MRGATPGNTGIRGRIVPIPVLAVLGLAIVAAAWAWFFSAPPTPDEQFARARTLLEQRFESWRGRVERAAQRVAKTGTEVGRRPFVEAQRIVREESVDGVALLKQDGRAHFWAGRTFEIEDPEVAFFHAELGVSSRILDHPAHPVLYGYIGRGDAIAVAFLAFDERFPSRRALGDEVRRATGLTEVRLDYGAGNVPIPTGEKYHGRVVIDGLLHGILVAPDDAARAEAETRTRTTRLKVIGFLLALVVALGLWTANGRRCLPGAALVVTLRLLLAWCAGSLVATPAAFFLSALATLAVAALLRPLKLTAFGFGALAAAIAYGLHRATGLLAMRADLFDPLRVLPGAGAALLLAGFAFLCVGLFLVAHAGTRQRRWAWVPFACIAVVQLPFHGPLLATIAALTAFGLARAATRPEKGAVICFLAALAAVPLLYPAHRDATDRAVAGEARALLNRADDEAARAALEAAVARFSSEERDVHGLVAQILAEEGRDAKHAAFRLWSGADWDPARPCAVQVFSPDGALVSAFDFDSPPARWLPAPPTASDMSVRVLPGRGEGESIRFFVRDFELRTIGDERLVGRARFATPDRWDMLVSPLRPSIFGEPRDVLVPGTAPPLAFAEFRATGDPRPLSSAGPALTLSRPSAAVLARAREDGFASLRVQTPGREVRLLVVPGPYGFGGVVFEQGLVRHVGFVLAHVLSVCALLAFLYSLFVLAQRRGRPQLLFRHRVGFVVMLLTLPPVVVLAQYVTRVEEQRHEDTVQERLRRRLDLAEALLRGRTTLPDANWCADVAADHFVDINVYRGQELLATSRPGVWDTGLLGRRLAAPAQVALVLDRGDEFAGTEFFGHDSSLRTAYRRVPMSLDPQPLILAAPALEDRRALQRRATESQAALLALYLLTATLTSFVALTLGRSLTKPVQRLQAATTRVAAGDLDAKLPEGRDDEFGALIRAFNRMTDEVREAQDLRVRAEKAAAWREMARQIAHEIKNPLTPIKLTVQNLRAAKAEDGDAFDEDFDRGAQLILDQIDALQRIADSFSAYARFPTQRFESVDLNALARDIGGLFSGAGGCALKVQTDNTPLTVRADPDELRRALINLVTNAQQSGAQQIEVVVTREGDRARVDVRDDGAGIPQDIEARIFDPSFTTKTSGTGLGLPIVKRIMDDHGGTIEIDTTPEKGTVITVRLPLSGGTAKPLPLPNA